MADTKTLLGEEGALNALIEQTVIDFVDDDALEVGAWALGYNSGLQSIALPSVKKVAPFSFSNCTNLTVIDLTAVTDFGLSAIAQINSLRHLVLRSSEMCSMNSLDYTMGNGIRSGNGAVYVPADLVASYKADPKWGFLTILPISAFPDNNYGAIIDTWTDIIEAENDGTYLSKYSIGDKKLVSINGSNRWFKIIGFDKDELADGTGTAKITWRALNSIYSRRMNASASTSGGWANSEMRSWLDSTILPTLPSDLQGYLKSVKKTYYDYGTGSTLSCNDKLWIPSRREMCYNGSSTAVEDSGCQYTDVVAWNVYTSAITQGTSSTWTRTAASSTDFVTANPTPTASTGAQGTLTTCPCFCT